MNKPATAHERADGYTQDPASQWVTELLDAQPGDRILDVCAAPGGKATALAADGAFVVAADLRPSRVQLMAGNVARTRRRSSSGSVAVLVADGRHAPFAPASFDKVLLDAPCSGLGVLRRRADARWRITPEDLGDLARLQQELIDESQTFVKPGGVLLYSVCTLTAAESIDHRMPEGWVAEPPTTTMWQPYGDGGRVLPHVTDGDGMTVRRYRRPS
jgi:16S rRNA (cytosine967-C5)-methyltransferase